MSTPRRFALLAAAVALVIAGLCFLANSPLTGLRTATVVTARFSGLVFAFALVARAPRPVRLASFRSELMLAFVAAHGIHFASVVSSAIWDRQSDFHNLRPQTFISFTLGFSLILALAFTIRATGAGRIAHRILIYVVAAIFLAAFFHGRSEPASAAMFVVMAGALLLRIALGFSRPAASAASNAP